MEKLFKYPVLVVSLVFVITVFFCLWIPRTELDNNNFRFLPDGNQAKITAQYIDETFGGQVMILIALERPYRSVFDRDFLQLVRSFAQEAEDVALVKTVNSIMTTQYITGDEDSIIVSDLVPENFSGTREDIDELKRRISSWDLFRGSLVSDDLSATQILITLDVPTADSARPEVAKSLDQLREIAMNIFEGEAQVYFTGLPVINAIINRSIITDNLLLIPLVFVIVLAMMFFSFRRFSFVILPLLTVIISVLWTMGMAAMVGMKISVLTTILPVILVAVGSAYGIHIVTHYAQDLQSGILGVEEHRALVLNLFKKMIKPVFLAALTTLAGFISFCFTPIIPMREFGYCAGFGVLTAFLMAVFFIPAMFLVRGPTKPKNVSTVRSAAAGQSFNNTVAVFFLGIVKKKYIVLAVAVLVALISIYGFTKVIIDNSVIDFFQHETDISRSDSFIRKYFGGSKDVNLVVEAETTQELLHPDVLCAIDSLSAYLSENVDNVGKVVGFTDIIKRINQVFNVNESPDGLRPVERSASVDDFGFGGFGDFGFGGFGFGDFGFSDWADSPPGYSGGFVPEVPPETSQENHNLAQYSAADLLRFLDNAAGKSSNLSGAELVSELKRLTNYEGMAYYEIPSDPARYGKQTREELGQLVAEYLVLLSGDDSILYSNDPFQPTSIRTMIQMRTTGSMDTKEIIDIINEYVDVNFPKNVHVFIGGNMMQEIAVTELIFNSQLISIIISVIMVFIIVALSNRSFIAGIIGAVPLTLAILCNFAVMGFIGIKLNLGTALISSLAVGIGIDYTIHFIEFFKREYMLAADQLEEDFLGRTYVGCGKAILINALSVASGFAVLAFSQFKLIAELGILIALSTLITALVSLTLIPSLLIVVKPRFIYGKKQGDKI